jgi:hypothetical protein
MTAASKSDDLNVELPLATVLGLVTTRAFTWRRSAFDFGVFASQLFCD